MGIIYAILSAITWGTGDFFGGLSTRRNSHFQVLVSISLVGAILMLVAVWITGEPWLSPIDALWAASAGFLGAIGIMALYTGLAKGSAALVSPVAAVLSAAIPLIASFLTEGLPAPLRIVGLMVAVPGIWQVARTSDRDKGKRGDGLGLAILAGLGFAGFFVLMAQVEEGQVFTPLVISKSTAFVIGLVAILRRKENFALPAGNPALIANAVFDAAGNVFFLLAEQHTRLDIASVLSSMYAAVTVLLSQIFLKERVTTGQWLGVGLCLLAIILIVL